MIMAHRFSTVLDETLPEIVVRFPHVWSVVISEQGNVRRHSRYTFESERRHCRSRHFGMAMCSEVQNHPTRKYWCKYCLKPVCPRIEGSWENVKQSHPYSSSNWEKTFWLTEVWWLPSHLISMNLPVVCCRWLRNLLSRGKVSRYNIKSLFSSY
jgi:hypothetical protein